MIACGIATAAGTLGMLCACSAAGHTSLRPPVQPAPKDTVLVARARYVMGSPLDVRTFAHESGQAAAVRALEAALDEVERLDAVLSNWKQDSELSRLNRAATSAPVHCSTDLFDVIEASLRARTATGGAFDPGLEPWTRALGLRDTGLETEAQGIGPSLRVPGPGGTVQLDRDGRTVSFSGAGTGLDLGGIGKGYALDAAGRVLRESGVRNALLNFGGQVLALGAPPGEDGWMVEVADPGERFRPVLRLRVRDASVATSANTERGVWRDGEWMGHVLDPHSGRSASFQGSATSVAADATRADAYATALLVMGPGSGLAWAERREDVAAVFLERDPEGQLQLWMTDSFEQYRAATEAQRAAR
ncbi:MAG: FAD:protein FMN transferase [Acidobacteriota bacterium]